MIGGLKAGNVSGLSIVSVSATPAQIAFAATGETTVAVPGVLATDVIVGVQAPSELNAALFLGEAQVTGANQVKFRIRNFSADTALTPPAGVWKFVILRSELTLGKVAV